MVVDRRCMSELRANSQIELLFNSENISSDALEIIESELLVEDPESGGEREQALANG